MLKRLQLSIAALTFAVLTLPLSSAHADEPLYPYPVAATPPGAAPAAPYPYPYPYPYPAYPYPTAGVPPEWQGAPPSAAPPPPLRRRPGRQLAPRATQCAGGSCTREAVKTKAKGKPRFFSIGGRATVLGINQRIGDSRVALVGGGVEARLRSRGRLGIELSLDFLKGRFGFGAREITRDSLPFQANLLIYVLRNEDQRFFNLYFLAGGGVVRTNMGLIDARGAPVEQEFLEYSIQGGLGLELRFGWVALRADARVMGLFRDDNRLPSRSYAEVEGAPVPRRSLGGQGTLGAAFWF